jgi:hypothetical protein
LSIRQFQLQQVAHRILVRRTVKTVRPHCQAAKRPLKK